MIVPQKIQCGAKHGYRNNAVYQRKGEFIMDYAAESLKLHYEWKGKLEVTPRAAVDSKDCLLYTSRCV